MPAMLLPYFVRLLKSQLACLGDVGACSVLSHSLYVDIHLQVTRCFRSVNFVYFIPWLSSLLPTYKVFILFVSFLAYRFVTERRMSGIQSVCIMWAEC